MKRVYLTLGLIVLAIFAWKLQVARKAALPEFAKIDLPKDASERATVPHPVPPTLVDFAFSGDHRLAILVTESDAGWIGLARAFDAHGIPYTMTTDPAVAMRQKVVLAYPTISGKVMSGDQMRALTRFAYDGGTLITSDLAGGGLEEFFGISSQTSSRERGVMRFEGEPGVAEDREAYFSAKESEAAVGSYAYEPTSAKVLARFADGSPAAVCRDVGGRACLVGLDIGSLAQRTMNGRSALVAGKYINAYQPSMDVLVRFIRDLYVAGDDDPYLIDTARRGSEGTLILTHDVDYTRSVRNSLDFAKALRARGATGTFFIQTKYVKDWNDDAFFGGEGISNVGSIGDDMEVGSHGVSHSRVFAGFPLGKGKERYPRYLPFVESQTSARNGTILGETRVSKYLLEKTTGRHVRSFRPGHLSYPEQLPEALAATGYTYSSTLTAPEAMTHLPFQLTHHRSEAGLLPVFEFPVTIEDERAPAFAERVDGSIAIIDKIAAHRGVAVLLNHPDNVETKLPPELRLVDHFKDRLWITSLGEFGDWWAARNQARISHDGEKLQLTSSAALDGLDIIFPKRGNKRVALDGGKGQRAVAID